MDYLIFGSEKYFELILAYSTLSQINIKIAVNTNLEYKKTLVKLLNTITKNSKSKFEQNLLIYEPGSLVGGKHVMHCKGEIYKIIEVFLVLCPFAREPLSITFVGATNDENCVDLIPIVHFPILKKFGLDRLELVVNKRGFPPEGRGEVYFTSGIVDRLCNVNLTVSEKIIKIRGLAISSHLSSIPVQGMTETIKSIFKSNNVKVYSNMANKNNSGPSPGFHCCVFAETKNGIYFSQKCNKGETSETTAADACKKLLRSILKGGVFDSKVMHIVMSYLALSPASINKIRTCRLNSEMKELGEILHRFFNFEYIMSKSDDGWVMTSYGSGYRNIYKSIS